MDVSDNESYTFHMMNEKFIRVSYIRLFLRLKKINFE